MSTACATQELGEVLSPSQVNTFLAANFRQKSSTGRDACTSEMRALFTDEFAVQGG